MFIVADIKRTLKTVQLEMYRVDISIFRVGTEMKIYNQVVLLFQNVHRNKPLARKWELIFP